MNIINFTSLQIEGWIQIAAIESTWTDKLKKNPEIPCPYKNDANLESFDKSTIATVFIDTTILPGGQETFGF